MENSTVQPIGVFDSGVGGISVLADLIQLLPNEKYIYFGDSKNAPYGIKSTEEVKERSIEVADFLVKKGSKLLVVACNTATSVAVNELRERFNIPVIGMEPALKPAVELTKEGSIVVMATPVTLKEKKFHHLIEQFQDYRHVIKLPCPGLVEIIESKGTTAVELETYLIERFSSINIETVKSIVLGCTHYVFIQAAIKSVVGEGIQFVDGNYGTAKHVERILQQENLLNKHNYKRDATEVKIYNTSSSDKIQQLSKELLLKRLSLLGFKGNLIFCPEAELAFKQQSQIQMI